MRTHPPAMRILVALGLWLALVAGLGFAPATVAQAATRYTVTASGAGTTTTDTARGLTVSFRKNGKAVKSAKAQLQYLSGTRWVTEKTVTIKKGKATVKVKHSTMSRTYRFRVPGKATSKSFVVHFVPATFTITGSGAGHGVGMSQYGAYELARRGRSAHDILTTYYSGAFVDPTVHKSDRTVKVQVFGPGRDKTTTTSLSLSSGGFTIKGAGAAVTTKPGKPVAIGVSGSNATAKVTLANGTVRTLSGSRLTVSWGSGSTASVAGTHGSYRYGTLQVTVLKKIPNVVNELRMNTEYLYGISEMQALWGSAANKGMEALKAQAIAARTYIITQASRANQKWGEGEADPACDCQVFDDDRHQNFTGWKMSAEDTNGYWRSAVDATATATTVTALRPSATATGEFAEALYFASSGRGTHFGTADSADVYGRAVPYLTHVEDPFSAAAPGNPHRSWKVTLSQARFRAIFGGTAVRSVALTARFPGGLVKTLTATTLSGAKIAVTRTSNEWRSLLGARAAWIDGLAGK